MTKSPVSAVPRRSFETSDYSSVQKLGADLNLPALRRCAPQRYPFLLQSTAAASSLAGFDILFACPGETLVLETIGSLSNPDNSGGFLTSLDEWWHRETADTVPSALPFYGGWFLYLGYELAAEIEPGLSHLIKAFIINRLSMTQVSITY